MLCNVAHHLGDVKRVIPRQSVQGSIRAIRAVRNTQVFQTETRVVADDCREGIARTGCGLDEHQECAEYPY